MKSDQFFGSWYLSIKTTQSWAYADNLFSKEECKTIKDLVLGIEDKEDAKTGSTKDNIIKESLNRKGHVSWLNSGDLNLTWVYQRLTDCLVNINSQFWNFDLDYIETLQFTYYDEEGDHYNMHWDYMHQGIHYRKLSFSVQLDDSDEYEGCDLTIFDGKKYIPTSRKQGTIMVFPSFTMHKVEKLISGKRHSIVGWVCGPKFK